MMQRCVVPLVARAVAQRAAVSTRPAALVRRALSTQSPADPAPFSSATAASQAPPSTLQPRAEFQPLIHPQEEIAPPPSKGRAAPLTFSMQVLFLGYGVGKFELEMLHGAPQLVRDGGARGQVDEAFFTAQSAAAAASRFDLSAHPAGPPVARQESGLRSSWISSKESQAALTQRDAPDPKFSNDLQFGGRDLQPAGRAGDAQPAVQRSQEQSAVTTERSAAAMPPNNRIIVHSSVIVYQNVMFCWRPSTLSEVTVESLSFLRTLTPRPELILLGTGSEISHRLSEEVLAFLSSLKIGVELMDSGNAIATYNILTDEGRTVLAAMIKKPPPKQVTYKETRSREMRRKLGYWND